MRVFPGRRLVHGPPRRPMALRAVPGPCLPQRVRLPELIYISKVKKKSKISQPPRKKCLYSHYANEPLRMQMKRASASLHCETEHGQFDIQL